MQLLDLNDDCLGLILARVTRRRRMSVLLTCKRFCRVALSRSFPPWDEGACGLLHAVEKGHLEYFDVWRKVAGDRWSTLASKYGSCWLQRALAKKQKKMFHSLLQCVPTMDEVALSNCLEISLVDRWLEMFRKLLEMGAPFSVSDFGAFWSEVYDDDEDEDYYHFWRQETLSERITKVDLAFAICMMEELEKREEKKENDDDDDDGGWRKAIEDRDVVKLLEEELKASRRKKKH